MTKKISVAILLLIFFTIVNVYVIRGSYTLYVYTDEVDETGIAIDKEDVLEVEGISFDERTGNTTIGFTALKPGDVTVTVDTLDPNSHPVDIDLVVDNLGFVTEKGFMGSMSNMGIVRYEIISVILIMMVNTFFSMKKEKKRSRYSYRLMFYMGAIIFLGISLLIWIYNTFINRYDGMDKLYALYADILSAFMTFAMVVFPLILLLAIFLVVSNIALIRHEGRSLTNALGIFLGIGLMVLTFFGIFSVYILNLLVDVNSYSWFHVSVFVEALIYILLSYLECMMLGTYICTARAQRHVPKFNKDYMIILGCAIRQDGTVTPLLKGRADRALWFAEKQKSATGKDLTFVASGGQGADEVISEAESIAQYLKENGIDDSHIILENKSTSTRENMQFSYDKICKSANGSKDDLAEDLTEGSKKELKEQSVNIAFSTTGYHVFRSGNIASSLGIPATGVGSKTKWYFYTNALIREFIANMLIERSKHIEKLIAMVLLIAALLIISYRLQIL